MELDDIGSDKSSGSNDYAPDSSALVLLPFTIWGIVAFIEKGAALAAAESLFGAGLLATAITEAFWVVGFITVMFIAAIAVITFAAFIAGIVRRKPGPIALGFIGLGYFLVSIGVALTLFSGLPLLVAFLLASNVFLWAVIVIIVVIVGSLGVAIV